MQFYATFSVDDSKRSIYMKTCRCVFLNKREVLFRFFAKSNILKYHSTYQTTFLWLLNLNAMCTFVYLFVIYFSFASVISASIHRYVNYFDIQVLMMVTETETLTSTIHHNIFTYLDYVFSATFIYIYIYIRVSLNKFPDFFCMGTFIDSTYMKLWSPSK